jgi:YD repeat-containing protein
MQEVARNLTRTESWNRSLPTIQCNGDDVRGRGVTTKIFILLVLIGSLPASAWAQGACTQYKTWWVSTGAGTGSEPVYWPEGSGVNQDMVQMQAQYGGAGPTCSASWEGVYGVWGGWSGECHSVGWTCAPPAPPVGGCPTCNSAGGPISLTNGNTYIQQTDVRLPGLGSGLTLTRTWNSTSSAGGIMFGPGWISTYEEGIGIGGDGTMKYTRADGSVWSFAYYGTPPAFHLIAPGNVQAATLTEQSTTSWTVTFQNGEQRVFIVNPLFLNSNGQYQNNNGRLVNIIDRNGNTTLLTYNTEILSGQVVYTTLASVTDPVGRHLYFTYGSSTSPSLYVTSVTSDSGSGINLTYTYAQSPLSGDLDLTEVTQADNTFVTFTYDAFNNITSVNDTNGKVLESHTYDSTGRGLSSSRANGVDALTISYPQ